MTTVRPMGLGSVGLAHGFESAPRTDPNHSDQIVFDRTPIANGTRRGLVHDDFIFPATRFRPKGLRAALALAN